MQRMQLYQLRTYLSQRRRILFLRNGILELSFGFHNKHKLHRKP